MIETLSYTCDKNCSNEETSYLAVLPFPDISTYHNFASSGNSNLEEFVYVLTLDTYDADTCVSN